MLHQGSNPVGLHDRKLDEHHELLIIAIVMENPCVYLREVSQRIEEATHTRFSGSTVCRILRKNGYTRKKIQQVARQKNAEYRAAFMVQVLQYDPEYFGLMNRVRGVARI